MIRQTGPVWLLTNDDGLEAPGLRALYQAASSLELGTLRVVAPRVSWSGCGHAVTTHQPFDVTRRADGWYRVEGSPADCVRVALHHLEPEAAWVLSGVNAGGNLGIDIYHSGTVAAAREAALHGRPAIAVSHYRAKNREIDWDQARQWTARVLPVLMARPWEPGTFWNVNLPHPEPGSPEPSIVFCPLDPSPLPLSYRVEGQQVEYDGNYQARDRLPGADIDTCFGGQIAVSLLRVGC